MGDLLFSYELLSVLSLSYHALSQPGNNHEYLFGEVLLMTRYVSSSVAHSMFSCVLLLEFIQPYALSMLSRKGKDDFKIFY